MKYRSVALTVCLAFCLQNEVDAEVPKGNIFYHDNIAIPVFTQNSEGRLVPVILDFSKIGHVKYPSQDVHTSWPDDSHQYVNTSRGPQHVHSCHGPSLVARGREHHQKLHRRRQKEEDQEELLHRHRRQATNQTAQISQQAHVIETLVVGDYELYRRFLVTNGDPNTALLAMAYYYANVFRSVNRRYESMARPPFFTTILPTNFIFLTLPQSSPWTEVNRVNQRVKSETALRAFTLYAQNAKTVAFFDHATLLSGYDLFSDNLRNNLLGVAFTYGVCSPECTSVIEESFSEQTANTLAHEIGHSLGSLHDEEGVPCSSADFFVMAPTSALPSSADKGGNPWIFSICSLNLIRTFLNTRDAECTLALRSTNQVDLSPFLQQEWGQTQNADFQCRQRYGPTSIFCREDYFLNRDLSFGLDMCYNLNCFNPRLRRCTPIPAHDGTSCGNRKWCLKGLCVSHPLAPSRLDTCPQLDDPTALCTTASCANPNLARAKCCATCNQSPIPPPTPSPIFSDFLPALLPNDMEDTESKSNQSFLLDLLFSHH